MQSGYESAELYYNMGNAYFKLGDLGRSVLFYERALRLRPRDEDVRVNLELVRSLAIDEIAPLPGFWLFRAVDWWVRLIPRFWLITIVAVTYLLTAVGLLAVLLTRSAALRVLATLRAGGARDGGSGTGAGEVIGLRKMVMVVLALYPANAQAQRTFFDEGNRAYQEGDYERALDRYQRVVQSGYESAELYYNMGNAYFKLGDLGRSVLFYERALRLRPRDEDVRVNLELVRSLAIDEIAPLPGFWLFRAVDWWVRLIPRFWLITIVAVTYLLTAVGLLAVLLTRSAALRVLATRVVIAAFAAFGIFGVNLAAVHWRIGVPVEAVVLTDEMPVYSAPSDDGTLELFKIHEGAKVRVDQDAGDWVEIVLADGKVGWARMESLGVI